MVEKDVNMDKIDPKSFWISGNNLIIKFRALDDGMFSVDIPNVGAFNLEGDAFVSMYQWAKQFIATEATQKRTGRLDFSSYDAFAAPVLHLLRECSAVRSAIIGIAQHIISNATCNGRSNVLSGTFSEIAQQLNTSIAKVRDALRHWEGARQGEWGYEPFLNLRNIGQHIGDVLMERRPNDDTIIFPKNPKYVRVGSGQIMNNDIPMYDATKRNRS